MEKSEISTHEIGIYRVFVQNPDKWLTNKEVAKQASANERTGRAHVLKLVKLGILDQAEVFPGHRYRLSKLAAKRTPGYVARLENAASVFGIALIP